jgi:hypothetical protein
MSASRRTGTNTYASDVIGSSVTGSSDQVASGNIKEKKPSSPESLPKSQKLERIRNLEEFRSVKDQMNIETYKALNRLKAQRRRLNRVEAQFEQFRKDTQSMRCSDGTTSEAISDRDLIIAYKYAEMRRNIDHEVSLLHKCNEDIGKCNDNYQEAANAYYNYRTYLERIGDITLFDHF